MPNISRLIKEGSHGQVEARRSVFEVYFPLIYSLFYFMAPIQIQLSLLEYVVIFVVYCLQCGLYLFMMKTDRHTYRATGLFISIAVAFLSTKINFSSYVFYWYCLFIAAFYFSLPVASIVAACVSGCIILGAYSFNLQHIWYYLPAIIPGFGLFCYGIYGKSLQLQKNMEQRSQEEVSAIATIAERERIARDLHDVMGHNLASITLKAELAKKRSDAGDMQTAIKEINEVAQISRTTLAEMRTLVNGYASRSFSMHIEKLTNLLQDADFSVESTIQLPTLSALEESTLTLVVTESITNIIKHSRGTRVRLSSEQIDQAHWCLNIQDNGPCDAIPEGNGIKGIRERLATIGAFLNINIDDGVKLTVRLAASP